MSFRTKQKTHQLQPDYTLQLRHFTDFSYSDQTSSMVHDLAVVSFEVKIDLCFTYDDNGAI